MSLPAGVPSQAAVEPDSNPSEKTVFGYTTFTETVLRRSSCRLRHVIRTEIVWFPGVHPGVT